VSRYVLDLDERPGCNPVFRVFRPAPIDARDLDGGSPPALLSVASSASAQAAVTLPQGDDMATHARRLAP
jgi:hypothetical protein